MRIEATAIDGAFLLSAAPDPDERGASTQLVDAGILEAALGRPLFGVRQVFHGRSRRGVVRGMHFTAGGSEKVVFAMSGHLHDVLVDVRVGSPTFGTHVVVQLRGPASTAVYVPEGVAHGYWCLENDSLLCYLLSNDYVPEREVAIDPFDPDLALPWPGDTAGPVMSPRDRAGLSLAEAKRTGRLPSWGARTTPILGSLS